MPAGPTGSPRSYGWRFFRDTARSRRRRLLIAVLAVPGILLRTAGRPPSLVLPYLNLVFRRAADP